jgi:hypothetical protein
VVPTEPYPLLGWLAYLLPYVEQEPLWREAQTAFLADREPTRSPPHRPFATAVAVYGCPADARTHQPQPTRNRMAGLTSYLGASGTDFGGRDGVFYYGSRVRLADVTDGTSNTLAAGERPPSADMGYGWWYAGYGQDGRGSADSHLGVRERNLGGPAAWTCDPGPYRFRRGHLGEQCDLFHFWSVHLAGGHFLMADGSVHFLGYGADGLLPALATRAGGDTAQLP